MIALIQRVSEASVRLGTADGGGGDELGRIGAGLLALVCAERCDTEREAERLLDRVLRYRVFSDEAGRMNRSLLDVQGSLLVVSQFTLAADTGSGLRPSFTPAAPAALGERLYERFVQAARQALEVSQVPQASPVAWQAGAAPTRVATGRFGADMRVSLVNDGPVTFWLRVAPQPAAA